MPQSQGIKVSVIHNDGKVREKAYREYPDYKVTYIKVDAGEKFFVKVEVTPEFDFKHWPEVEVLCSINGEDMYHWALTKADVEDPNSEHHPVRFIEVERFIRGQWMSCAMSFGDLAIDEYAELTREQVREHMQLHGTIHVSVKRGLTRDIEPELVESYAYDVDSSSREVVKHHHGSHTLKHVPVEKGEHPENHWKFFEAFGDEVNRLLLPIPLRTGARAALHHPSQTAPQ